MFKKEEPSYNLAKLQELLKREESRVITKSARQAAVSLGYADDEDMVRMVLRLIPLDFYKTMPADKSVLMQDVYHTYDKSKNLHLYIKLQLSFSGKNGIIISFKEK